MDFLNEYVLGPAVSVGLIGAGIYFSILLKFFHIRRPLVILRSMFKNEVGGGISAFGASMMALAGTLGVGNIVGVASAISLGGAGAIFWMWVSALAAMVLKYAEIVLAVRYRENEGGKNYGGAMYYIRAAFGGRVGKILAGVFSAFCIINALGMGAMIQMNAASDLLFEVMSVPRFTTGIVAALLALFSVLSGTVILSKITQRLVPLMSVLYMGMALLVIFSDLGELSSAFGAIFKGAFSYESAAGGVFGFLFSRTLRLGTMRGLLSNEAGCGTAPIAYASSNEKSPAKQGFWGLFEVFFDTVILCTMTALVILVSPVSGAGEGDVMMTVDAFCASLGAGSAYILAAAVFMFAFATVICWADYGLVCARYFGKTRTTGTVFLCLYFVSIVFGSLATPAVAWKLTDLSLSIMTLINLFALIVLAGDVKKETDSFFKPLK